MENWVAIAGSLFGGLGLGGLFAVLLKENFESKKFRFREKLQAYSGYLEAFQNAVVESSEANRQKVVYWHKRIELVAPQHIVEKCQKMYDSSQKETAAIRDALVLDMRKDLKL